jgi:hypothetical protein
MAVVAAGRRSAATVDGLGEAAAHAARAAVRRPLAGYDHPALARSRRRNNLLHLFADHGGAFATDRIGLRAIRLEHDRLDELRRGRTRRRAARGGSATGDDVTTWRRHRHSGAPHLALASIAASSGTYSSGCAAGIALVIHGTHLEERDSTVVDICRVWPLGNPLGLPIRKMHCSERHFETSTRAHARASWEYYLDPRGETVRVKKMSHATGKAGDRGPRRKHRPRCHARTRAGGGCLVRVEPGKARCRFHGGLSTGPRTEEGRVRIAEAQRRRWRAYRASQSSK